MSELQLWMLRGTTVGVVHGVFNANRWESSLLSSTTKWVSWVLQWKAYWCTCKLKHPAACRVLG